ncbi:MAG: hypothetical protein ACJAWL_003006 [Motiliproteus sp.]
MTQGVVQHGIVACFINKPSDQVLLIVLYLQPRPSGFLEPLLKLEWYQTFVPHLGMKSARIFFKNGE